MDAAKIRLEPSQFHETYLIFKGHPGHLLRDRKSRFQPFQSNKGKTAETVKTRRPSLVFGGILILAKLKGICQDARNLYYFFLPETLTAYCPIFLIAGDLE